ncbi:MAG: low molecular weight protein-tyrosine phosphatase [Phycisphaerales bacterium]|jgi:protein-tyrosine-phosphatase|nr:low molecular weight protein-tyrosine phosphatase [Phycisphaerales bacterium]
MSHTVLFLCTGNYYRSRFAAILFNHLARQRGIDWSASSRGLKIGWPGNHGALSPHTERRLAEMNINFDDSRHMPLQCRECDLAAADLVVALKEAEHRAMLAEKFRGWEERVRYWHVHDVDAAKPEDALREIEKLVREFIDDLRSYTMSP